MSIRAPEGESVETGKNSMGKVSNESSSNVNSNKKKQGQHISIHSMDMTKKSLC